VAIPVVVPRLGWSMEEGTLLEWLKQDGDNVRMGDPLFVLESEKAAEQIEAIDSGILRIPPDGPKPGDRVTVGQVLAHLAADGEAAPIPSASTSAATPAPAKEAAPAGPATRRLARAMKVDLAVVAGSGPGGRITESDVRGHQRPTPAAPPAVSLRRGIVAVTPRARRAARELGIDVAALPGSGRNGRIRERDVRCAIPATPAVSAPSGKLIPHSPTRRTIAARMVAGVTQAAPVTLTTKVDAESLVQLRESFRTCATADGFVPSYTDLLLKLTAMALRKHPLLQAQWRDEGLFVPDRTDIALAVDTDSGLLAPVVRGVEALSLRPIAERCRELIALARAGKLTSEQMRDATFTITNLGGLGVDAFTPIITLPQCAVLGVGRIVREPAVVGDAVVPRHRLTLSLTFDHRIVDGAPAARFLDSLRRAIEEPVPSLLS
jgi:pyruvate dehydrogenase E2 component (dihydrolipoamide acetyltransferase)